MLPSLHRHFVQPELHRVVRGPGHGDEGHPGGSEDEGADPEGAAATSPAEHGRKAVRPELSGPQQLSSRQGQNRFVRFIPESDHLHLQVLSMNR